MWLSYRVDDRKVKNDGSVDWRTRKGIQNMHFDERERKDKIDSDKFDTFVESNNVVDAEAGENNVDT